MAQSPNCQIGMESAKWHKIIKNIFRIKNYFSSKFRQLPRKTAFAFWHIENVIQLSNVQSDNALGSK